MKYYPFKRSLVVKVENEEYSSGGIALIPKEKGERFEKGVVIDIGSEASQFFDENSGIIEAGSEILFDMMSAVPHPDDKNIFFVDYHVIAACLNKPDSLGHDDDFSFFQLPSIDDFADDDHWKKYENLSDFKFIAQHLEPFSDINVLVKNVYEICVKHMKDVADFEPSKIKYKSLEDRYIIAIEDVEWEGKFILMENALIFHKQGTTVSELYKTLPIFMRIFYNILKQPANTKYFGTGCNRVTKVSIGFEQKINLEGRGLEKSQVYNSDIMRELIKLQPYATEKRQSLLEILGFNEENIGRTDVKLSFNRDVGEHEYTIWLDAKAPLNNEKSVLFLEWTLVDEPIKDLLSREYGPTFSYFFKDIVLGAFYREWLKEIRFSMEK